MNVMTLPYGGTPYGLGTQQIDDAPKHGIPLLATMEHRWATYMGRVVYGSCDEILSRLMQLLRLFESAGKQAEEDLRFLRWTVPITNFPVVQHYTDGTVKKVWVEYGPIYGDKLSTGKYANCMQLNVCFTEIPQMSKRKQAQGAAPNIIHSLDAAHLMLIVNAADFDVTTVHDSFGAHLSDMPKLYRIVRETFVDLYRVNPLEAIAKEIGVDISGMDYGTLNIEDILESEFAFI